MAMKNSMSGVNLRRAERQSAIWLGTCHIEGEAPDLWRDCGVFDLSRFGLGMDLRLPSDLVVNRASVRLPVDASIDATITGEVRSAKPGPDGVMRLGIEFMELSKIERSIVDLLILRAKSKP
jgi:PilZ domain